MRRKSARLPKLKNKLIRLALHGRVEDLCLVVVCRISQLFALANELEAGRFNFLLYGGFVDPMKRFGIPKARARLRRMIEYDEDATRLQRIEDSLVDHTEISRSEKLIMKVV